MKRTVLVLWASLLVGGVFLVGCDDGTNFTDVRRSDASSEGGDSGGVCARGQYTCRGALADECDGQGGTTGRSMDCAAMGQNCVNGLGCRVCRPNDSRCSPMNAAQTQQCNPDGTQWLDGPMCNAAMGQTCNAGMCEDRCRAASLSYLGCEYWPTITANSQLDRAFSFAVVVANPNTYPVSLNVTGGRLASAISRTLMPGGIDVVQLPPVDALIQNNRPAGSCGAAPCIATSAMVMNGAYHVQANGPIAAYQFNPLTYRTGSTYSFTNDASLLLPTRVLTNHYIVNTRNNWTARDALGTARATLGGFVAIVGVDPAETGTAVTVRRTTGVSAGPGVTASNGPGTDTYTLRQGDVVQLVGHQQGGDLTGTIIEGNHPFAVFTGHDCSNVPDMQPACDHMEEQLFPSATWGRRYAVTQPRIRGANEPHRVRIISQRAGNALTFEGIGAPAGCPATINAGQFCEFQTTSSFIVSGTQPFLVMQFMVGQGMVPASHARICFQADGMTPTDVDDPVCMGDPAMVTEVPIEQFRTSYDFLVPDTYRRNMINVVAPPGVNITLDGAAIAAMPNALGSGLSVYFVPIMPGRHHIESAGGQGIGLKVYGLAQYTSYMYPGGLDLAAINPPG